MATEIPREEISWEESPYRLEPREGTVDLFWSELECSPRELERLADTLNEDEQHRARRYLDPTHGRRFTVSRGTLRCLLATALEIEPGSIGFEYGEHGKPRLADAHQANLEFNVSHSGERLLIAATPGRALGIDIEQIRSNRDLTAIARRYFSPGEVEVLLSLPETAQTLAFYRCWSRKEAYMKAKGGGLSIPLNHFEVSLAPNEPARLISSRLERPENRPWIMAELMAGPDFAAAVAVEGPEAEFRAWRLGRDAI